MDAARTDPKDNDLIPPDDAEDQESEVRAETDPKKNDLIPDDEAEGREVERGAETVPPPPPDLGELEDMLERAIGDGEDLGDELHLCPLNRVEGYYVMFDCRMVSDLSSLPEWALQRIRKYFKKCPQGNDLIPPLDE